MKMLQGKKKVSMFRAFVNCAGIVETEVCGGMRVRIEAYENKYTVTCM